MWLAKTTKKNEVVRIKKLYVYIIVSLKKSNKFKSNTYIAGVISTGAFNIMAKQ